MKSMGIEDRICRSWRFRILEDTEIKHTDYYNKLQMQNRRIANKVSQGNAPVK